MGAAPKAEEQKIEALIDHVRQLDGKAVFIRNGDEHSAKDAAEHMARKRKSAGDDVKTAKAFIAECASKSSLSGKPYQIRFKDGKTVTAEAYLTEQLSKLESGKP